MPWVQKIVLVTKPPISFKCLQNLADLPQCCINGGLQTHVRGNDIPLLNPKIKTGSGRGLVCGSLEPQFISCHIE